MCYTCVTLYVFQPDGEDDLKKRQLMELAIINGTYRDTSKPNSTQTTTPSAARKSGVGNGQSLVADVSARNCFGVLSFSPCF